MRVITGSAKGRKLISPEGTDVRPTSDMVKEAIFSIINFEIEGARVLDLFAGSGQIGIEALSRGALSATFIDNSRESQKIIMDNLKLTGLMPQAIVLFTDFKTFLSGTSSTYDIAFLDPPYDKKMIEEALPLLVNKMSDSGIIICETDKKEDLPNEMAKFSKYREYRYGKKKLTVYRQTTEE